MNTEAARQAARIEAGRISAGRIEPGRRKAVRLADAFAKYLIHLESKAKRKGKPARWHRNAKQLGDQLLLPEFGKWPLSDLSNNPAIVAEWHAKITEASGPVQANRAAQVLRATYRHASKLNRSLPPGLPTSAVEFNPEAGQGTALAFKDFPKWREAWERIESPIRRSFHLTNLLAGCRPGELARLRREDIRPSERVFILRRGKAGADIRVILSVPIVRALRLALDAGDGELVFPECSQAAHRDELPARGMQLRRTYRTVAADVGVDEMLSHFLLSHAPAGISQRYVARMILQSGQAMREAQRSVSRRISDLLGLHN
jgi:integrase